MAETNWKQGFYFKKQPQMFWAISLRFGSIWQVLWAGHSWPWVLALPPPVCRPGHATPSWAWACTSRNEGAGENPSSRSCPPIKFCHPASWQSFHCVLINAEIQLTRTVNSLSILLNWIFTRIAPNFVYCIKKTQSIFCIILHLWGI